MKTIKYRISDKIEITEKKELTSEKIVKIELDNSSSFFFCDYDLRKYFFIKKVFYKNIFS